MINSNKVLVTGGAGYIGSHVVKQLGQAGYNIVVYDNLSTGVPESLLFGELIVGDLSETEKLENVFAQNNFDAVLHFAASIVVPESIENPLAYYSNNTVNVINVLKCCQSFDVNRLVFSSTAAVYGEPKNNPVAETAPTKPINPYGTSKCMSELIIQDYARASDLKYVILRYFNVAGADPDGLLGQWTPEATHLIRAVCDAALGRKPSVQIFGTDFDTPDGTGVRDYIHVADLACAHLDALRFLESGHDSQIFNCGYGRGYSVQEVIDCIKHVSGRDFRVIEAPRRIGDPASVISEALKIREVLKWDPQHISLLDIVETAWQWEVKRQHNFSQAAA